jgi:hypothetical protein
VVPGSRLQSREFMRFCPFFRLAKCEPGGKVARMSRLTGRSLFNNMVVLSRAFWVQDNYGNTSSSVIEMNTKNVSAKRIGQSRSICLVLVRRSLAAPPLVNHRLGI